MRKRICSLLMAGVLAGTLLAGCGANDKKTDAKDSAKQEQTSAQGEKNDGAAKPAGDSYTIATNTWGAGAYPLEDIVRNDQYLCDQLGFTLDVANNEFTADKVVSQLESQLANSPDGVLFLGIAQTTFVPVVNAIHTKGIPFAFDSNFPEEQLQKKCAEMEEFCGGVSADPYAMGKTIADQALKDGHKTAVLDCAAIGDYSHDNRAKGFKETFEAGGGKVLQEAHSSDPSEAVAKTNDLLTAQPDADCLYATGGDYLSAAVSVKESRKLDIALYGTDIDPSLVPACKDGQISAMNGGQGVCGVLAMTLIINKLDGKQILDADGKAPMFENLNPFVITPENAEGFQKLYDDGANFVGMDNFNKLLYRSNPDVSIDTYNEVLEGYADSVYAMLP